MNELQAHLLDAVRHAPSLMNAQPWKVSFGDDAMSLRLDPSRLLPALDPDGRAAWMGLGCAAENACLTLEQIGYEGECRVGETVSVSWRPRTGPPPDASLYRMIPLRRSSRRPFQASGGRQPPESAHFVWLPDQSARVREHALAILSDPARAREAYRWTRHAPGPHRDGLTADTLGLRPWEGRIAGWLTHPFVPAWIRRCLLDDVPPAPLWGLLLAHSPTLAGHFSAGRRLQRLWLEATACGLSLHPVRAALDPPGCLLFRMGTSPPVPASPRLPADELLE